MWCQFGGGGSEESVHAAYGPPAGMAFVTSSSSTDGSRFLHLSRVAFLAVCAFQLGLIVLKGGGALIPVALLSLVCAAIAASVGSSRRILREVVRVAACLGIAASHPIANDLPFAGATMFVLMPLLGAILALASIAYAIERAILT